MLVRRVARPLLASWYLTTGVDAVRRPAPHTEAARPLADKVANAAGLRRSLTERELKTAVRVHGVATAVAAVNLAVGRAPRASGLALAALTAPLAVVHQPWTGRRMDPEKVQPFVQSLGALGAALLAGADTAGNPSFGWRVRQARGSIAAHATDAVDTVVSSATSTGIRLGRKVSVG